MGLTTNSVWKDYERAEEFLPWNVYKQIFTAKIKPNWIKNSDEFWYLSSTRSGNTFLYVDPKRKFKKPAFDHVKLAKALSKITGKSYKHNNLPFKTIEFIENGRAISFEVEGKCWICNLKTYECTQIEKKPKAIHGALLSPDGRLATFVKENNLYVRSLDTNEEIQLTNDGVPYYDYATSPESNTSAVTDRIAALSGKLKPPVVLWSPDSKKLLTHRLDQRNVKEMYLLQSVPSDKSFRPVLYKYRYPLAGDEEVAQAELVIFDIAQRTKVPVKYEPQSVTFLSLIELNNVWWSKDSKLVYFIYMERGDKVARFCEVDSGTGAVRLILEERGFTYVDLNPLIGLKPNIRILNGGDKIIWFSERDGWGHLYLYDGKGGALINQITSGPWSVRDIIHVDEDKGWVYFTAGGREKGRDPYYRHLYRVNLDGDNLQLLTPEDADHDVMFSPVGNYFVDTYSRVDAAPVSVLRACDGQLVVKLEEGDVELLLAKKWQWPERFTVKARDGVTDLYGVLFRPSTFDPAKKYPVIDSIYPGPQVIRTPKAFPSLVPPMEGLHFWEPQALAELGFIVVTVDGLGTPLRSKLFHDFSYGNLGDACVEDHITALQQLASRYPYMDLNRVGIYGHSGGGYAAVRAILSHPKFFKVAVSSSGNHDQRGYVAIWGEKYQGLPKGDNYLNAANAELAANLEGKLLLIYGDMDDNTHPAMTIQLIDALIKANKDFDLLVMPNRNHLFLHIDPYYIRKRWDYLVQHLLNQTPPKGYKIKEIDSALLMELVT